MTDNDSDHGFEDRPRTGGSKRYTWICAFALVTIGLGATIESYMEYRSSGWKHRVKIAEPSRIPAADPEGWKQLCVGMSRAEVEKLLVPRPICSFRLFGNLNERF